MFAITFDLVTAETRKWHPKSVSQAYTDIGRTLETFDFTGIQGSVYLTRNGELANMYSAVEALKALPWLAKSVRDLRVFRVDYGSDFTFVMKNGAAIA